LGAVIIFQPTRRMNDRLGDIGGGTPSWAIDDEEVDKLESGRGGSLELTKQTGNDVNDDKGELWGEEPVSQPKYMVNFFKDVDDIKADIDVIIKSTRKIKEISEEAVLATTTDRENELSAQLKPLVDHTNRKAKRAKNILALLKEENSELVEKEDVKASDLRIRENLCNTLLRKFIDEMKLYQSSQQKYKSDIKKKMKRQVQIVKPDATDKEIEEVMRDGGGRDKLLRETILAGGVNESITNTYQNVAGKYQDVLVLESSVAELHQMFLDFAVLTEQQGELLDQIEFQVRSAAEYVEDGNVQVFESIQYQKKIRKKQCWIIIIVLVVVLIIMFSMGIIP